MAKDNARPLYEFWPMEVAVKINMDMDMDMDIDMDMDTENYGQRMRHSESADPGCRTMVGWGSIESIQLISIMKREMRL